jgi:hypothetical protein
MSIEREGDWLPDGILLGSGRDLHVRSDGNGSLVLESATGIRDLEDSGQVDAFAKHLVLGTTRTVDFAAAFAACAADHKDLFISRDVQALANNGVIPIDSDGWTPRILGVDKQTSRIKAAAGMAVSVVGGAAVGDAIFRFNQAADGTAGAGALSARKPDLVIENVSFYNDASAVDGFGVTTYGRSVRLINVHTSGLRGIQTDGYCDLSYLESCSFENVPNPVGGSTGGWGFHMKSNGDGCILLNVMGYGTTTARVAHGSVTLMGAVSGHYEFSEARVEAIGVHQEGDRDAAGTPVACTGDAATDVISRTAHGFSNGGMIYFPSLTGGAGLSSTTTYFVRDATANTFKVATSLGGTAVDITTDLTAGTVAARGKLNLPLMLFKGGEYALWRCDFYTLNNPARPAIRVDNSSSQRTTLAMRDVRFLQRIDDPNNAYGATEPIGDVTGTAIDLVSFNERSEITLENTWSELFGQVSGAGTNLSDLRDKFVPLITSDDATLQTVLDAAKMLLGSNITVRKAAGSWSVRAFSPLGALRGSTRQATPTLTAALGSTLEKAAFIRASSMTNATYYYKVAIVDAEGHQTPGSTERSVTLATGDVAKLTVEGFTGPVRLKVARGTSAGVYTGGADIYVPKHKIDLFDTGDHIGGVAWGAAPSFSTVNNTADGIRHTGATSGRFMGYSTVATLPTSFGGYAAGDWLVNADGVGPFGWRYNGTTLEPIRAQNPAALTSGESTVARESATSSGLTMTSQLLRLAFFRAEKSETITKLRVNTGATAAGATPTLIRYGLYTVDDTTGDLALVASTANDTALLALTSTEYEKALSGSYAKVAGVQYAIGVLVVTGATAPSLAGSSLGLSATEVARGPRRSATLAAQADLPATISAGSLAASASIVYAVAQP